MSQAKKPDPESLAIKINSDRLEQWREQRAEVAEKSRQERLRAAEAERQARLEKFEKEKAERLREAAAKRAREDAARKAERRARAQAQMPARSEIDAAAARLIQYRRAAFRRLVTQIATFVVAPTALIAVYLFAIATPLFEARTHLLLIQEGPTLGQTEAGIFGAAKIPGGAADKVRAIVRSPAMLTALEEKAGFISKMSSEDVDLLTRLTNSPVWQRTKEGQYTNFVDLELTAGNDIGVLSVKALSRDDAMTFSQTILNEVEQRLGVLSARMDGNGAITATQMLPPAASEIAVFPRRINGVFLALIVFAALFGTARVMLSAIQLNARQPGAQ